MYTYCIVGVYNIILYEPLYLNNSDNMFGNRCRYRINFGLANGQKSELKCSRYIHLDYRVYFRKNSSDPIHFKSHVNLWPRKTSKAIQT